MARRVPLRRTTVAAGLALALAVAPVPARSDPVIATYVVTFDAIPTATQLLGLGGVAVATHGFAHLPAAVAVMVPGDVATVLGQPGVLTVEPDRAMRSTMHESVQTINADQVWTDPALGYDGSGIGVAVIDTGVDGTHPDLCVPLTCPPGVTKVVQNIKVLGRQDVAVDPVVLLEDQVNTDTSSGHGSHVAGIAGGRGAASTRGAGYYSGVAPGSRLIGLGTGEALEVSNVLAAFDWVLEHKDDPAYNIKVLNNSWGPGAGEPYNPNDPVQLAIAAAYDAGLSVVFGSGNDGPAANTLNAFSVNPKAISVAAGSKLGHLGFFSSRGIPGDPFWRPTVTAPGTFIAAPRASTGFYSDVGDASSPNPHAVAAADVPYYATGNGTSMAAPHVTGVIALLQQASFEARGVYLTPAEVKAVLQNTAVSDDPLRGPGGLPGYQGYTMGAGYVDARAAVEAAQAGTSLQAYDDGVHHDTATFSGAVGPAAFIPMQSFDTTFEVTAGATSLDVMVDWAVVANDVDIDLFDPSGALVLSTFLLCGATEGPNQYGSYCTQKANERINVPAPAPGVWRANIHGGVLAATDTARGTWSVVYPDVTPSAPASLTATAGPGRGEISLAWTPPTWDGGQPVTSYQLDRDGSPVGTFTTLDVVDAGLGDADAHTYQVRAVNSLGAGPPSAPATATTFELPAAPTSLTAAAGPGAGEVTLTWSPPTGTPVTGYRVFRGTRTSRLSFVAETDVTPGFVDGGLKPGTAYYYAVSATNPVGAGPRSGPAGARTFALPGTPANVTATSGPGAGEISLAWVPPTSDGGSPVSGYVVYRGTSSKRLAPWAPVGGTSFVDSGLAPGSRWWYAVAAVTVAGEGKRSRTVRGTAA